mgnify:CR=1 FL=1
MKQPSYFIHISNLKICLHIWYHFSYTHFEAWKLLLWFLFRIVFENRKVFFSVIVFDQSYPVNYSRDVITEFKHILKTDIYLILIYWVPSSNNLNRFLNFTSQMMILTRYNMMICTRSNRNALATVYSNK